MTTLPYHKHMDVKFPRPCAGWEELRVDLQTIRALIRRRTVKDVQIAQYILQDRLLAYSMVDLTKQRPKMVFDTIGSQILMIRLLELKAITRVGQLIHLEPNWESAILAICQEFEKLELHLFGMANDIDRRAYLLKYIKTLLRKGARQFGGTKFSEDNLPMLNIFFEIFERVRKLN